MSLGYGDVGAFGGDGSCAVCLVAGGSVGCGHRACISANDAEVAVFANHEGADPAVERLLRLRRAAEFRVRVRAWGGKLGDCFGVDRQLRMEVAKIVDAVPKLLTLFLFVFLGGFLGLEETGVEEEPWPYVGYPLSYDPITVHAAVGN
jgi:hypothetical protein